VHWSQYARGRQTTRWDQECLENSMPIGGTSFVNEMRGNPPFSKAGGALPLCPLGKPRLDTRMSPN